MKEARVVRVEEATKGADCLAAQRWPDSHPAWTNLACSFRAATFQLMFFSNRTVPLTPPSLVKLSCIAASLLTGLAISVPSSDQVPELRKAVVPPNPHRCDRGTRVVAKSRSDNVSCFEVRTDFAKGAGQRTKYGAWHYDPGK